MSVDCGKVITLDCWVWKSWKQFIISFLYYEILDFLGSRSLDRLTWAVSPCSDVVVTKVWRNLMLSSSWYNEWARIQVKCIRTVEEPGQGIQEYWIFWIIRCYLHHWSPNAFDHAHVIKNKYHPPLYIYFCLFINLFPQPPWNITRTS
jgi:hypothetical protein